MESYKVEWKRSAVKELRKLPQDAVLRILKVLGQLPENPYPSGVRKLVQNTVIVFEKARIELSTQFCPQSLVIEIIRVGHRKDVYNRY